MRGRHPPTALPWVNHRSPRWEPEPLRWLGVNVGLRVMGSADGAEERSRQAGPPGRDPRTVPRRALIDWVSRAFIPLPPMPLRTMVVAYADVLDGALEPLGPRAAEPTAATPGRRGSSFFEGHGVSVGVWECTPGGWSITDRGDTGTMLPLAGAVTITPLHGSPSTSRRATCSSCRRAGRGAGT